MSSSQPTQPKKLGTAMNFATSGLGGILGWVVVHPFNTIAVRMNLAVTDSAGKAPSFLSFAGQQVKDKGFMSLYSGLSAGCTRQLFYATSRFGLYEVFRDYMAKYRETDLFSRLLTGSVSGGIAAMISCPAEVSLVRLSNDSSLPEAQRRNYKGFADAVQRILKEEGPKAFFR
jgi:solute carrier family 25 oxoglutarate transporter 11